MKLWTRLRKEQRIKTTILKEKENSMLDCSVVSQQEGGV